SPGFVPTVCTWVAGSDLAAAPVDSVAGLAEFDPPHPLSPTNKAIPNTRAATKEPFRELLTAPAGDATGDVPFAPPTIRVYARNVSAPQSCGHRLRRAQGVRCRCP